MSNVFIIKSAIFQFQSQACAWHYLAFLGKEEVGQLAVGYGLGRSGPSVRFILWYQTVDCVIMSLSHPPSANMSGELRFSDILWHNVTLQIVTISITGVNILHLHIFAFRLNYYDFACVISYTVVVCFTLSHFRLQQD